MIEQQVVGLKDGYNGHTAKFFTKPVDIDGHLVKLQCAERGKEYMIRWARIADIKNV